MHVTLLDSIASLPKASTGNADFVSFLQDLRNMLLHQEDTRENQSALTFTDTDNGKRFLNVIFLHSPYLSRLLLQRCDFFSRICHYGVVRCAEEMRQGLLGQETVEFPGVTELMQYLRQAKQRCALLTAIADLSGIWNLGEVTGHLSEMASAFLSLAVNHLLRDAYKRGELTHINPKTPSLHSGWIILGMGKLGAEELNYSSDIDLIILFDPSVMRYEGKQTAQQCLNRMTRDLVRIMQERTADGYVFRTDIRLRPDPASTPPAMSVNAAMTYYETVGQNWERAALIKARPVAGDIEAGNAFLTSLTPFIWRKTLDFAAIADIHSIKRQIDHRTGSGIKLAGHNLKLGAGGIREIEFFVQVQQLIWGGRKPELRQRSTCVMLERLADDGIILPSAATELQESYRFLRMLEHRVQMVRDQQTHSLPAQAEALESLARFAGFSSTAELETHTLKHLQRVKDHYSQLYGVENSLGHEGSLVFTGVEPDPDTMQTLSRMGFTQVETVCERIMSWHRGGRRAIRYKRARELLTEVTPELLSALAATAHPDSAFLKFDEFLGKLPSGVQIFSLFAANPHLLKLIANIMGSAPGLAETLSRKPELLDTVLTGAFYDPLPDKGQLKAELDSLLAHRQGFEDFVNLLTQFKNEKSFQAGVQLINRIADCKHTGRFLSELAEVILAKALQHIRREFAATYGYIAESELAVIAMGKLGARELTFASDLDLIFIYTTPSAEALSDGTRPFPASVYYNRLCQRFIGMLTALTPEGRLYEVDARLRPLGSNGPLAASVDAYTQYFHDSAWTFEFMALTRARVIEAPETFKHSLGGLIYSLLHKERDPSQTRKDIAAMREKVEKEYGTANPWNMKYIRGGVMDIDFIAQYLQLTHAHAMPELLSVHTENVLEKLEQAELADREMVQTLLSAFALYAPLLHLLRLCNEGTLIENNAPEGLKKLLCEHLGFESFENLKSALIKMQEAVYKVYQHFFSTT